MGIHIIFVVAVFLIGGLFGYSLGFDRGKFDEMKRRQGE